MKKLLIGIVAVSLLALIAVPAMAESVEVVITVQPYGEIVLPANVIPLTIDAGPTEQPASLIPFTLNSNNAFQVIVTADDQLARGRDSQLMPAATHANTTDKILYWPQLKVPYPDWTSPNPGYDEGTNRVLFWDHLSQLIDVSYTGSGSYDMQIGVSSCITDTPDGLFAPVGIYEGTMILTLSMT